MHLQKAKHSHPKFWIMLPWLLLPLIFLPSLMAFLVLGKHLEHQVTQVWSYAVKLNVPPMFTPHPRLSPCYRQPWWLPRAIHQLQQNCLSILSPLILQATSCYVSCKIEWNKNLVGIQCLTRCDERQSGHTRLAPADTKRQHGSSVFWVGDTWQINGCRLKALSFGGLCLEVRVEYIPYSPPQLIFPHWLTDLSYDHTESPETSYCSFFSPNSSLRMKQYTPNQ